MNYLIKITVAMIFTVLLSSCANTNQNLKAPCNHKGWPCGPQYKVNFDG